jgi:hypothetical protein
MRIPPILPIALALAASGCSSLSQSGSADAGPVPVFTSVVFPATASIGADGQYDFPGKISFSSPTSPVSTIAVVSQALMYTDTVTIDPATAVNGGALPLTFPPNFASGTQADWSLTLVDEAGAQSTPATGTVTLE